MNGWILGVAGAALLLATGAIALATGDEWTITAKGVPTPEPCDAAAASCFVGVGGYVLRVAAKAGETGGLMLAEAEEAHRMGVSRSYRGIPEIDAEGLPAMRRGRPVLIDQRR